MINMVPEAEMTNIHNRIMETIQGQVQIVAKANNMVEVMAQARNQES